MSALPIRPDAGGSHAVRPAGLADVVYESVKSDILNGVLLSDSKIDVDALAERLNVSRQPVRTALKRLRLEGFVVIVPQSGSVVARYEARDIEDTFRLGAAIMGVMTALAATRRTDSQLREMQAVSREIGALVQSDASPQEKSDRYRVLNGVFHRLELTMADSAMAPVADSFLDRMDFMTVLARHAAPFSYQLWERHIDHEDLIDAIAAGDAERARAITQRHIQRNLSEPRARSTVGVDTLAVPPREPAAPH
jgi:DNA-binding GntR family transcriptional regulator